MIHGPSSAMGARYELKYAYTFRIARGQHEMCIQHLRDFILVRRVLSAKVVLRPRVRDF